MRLLLLPAIAALTICTVTVLAGRSALAQVTAADINPKPVFAEWQDGYGPHAPPSGFTTGLIKFEPLMHDVRRVMIPRNAPSIVLDYGSFFTARGRKRQDHLGRHSGIDITAPLTYPVMAAADGKVVLARTFEGPGHSIVIEHGTKDGKQLMTAYIHLNEHLVPEGADVKRGQIIGSIGNTGRAWEKYAHLHWGVGLLPAGENATAFHDFHVNPHNFWVAGPGLISCFDKDKTYPDQTRFTYPVPCVRPSGD